VRENRRERGMLCGREREREREREGYSERMHSISIKPKSLSEIRLILKKNILVSRAFTKSLANFLRSLLWQGLPYLQRYLNVLGNYYVAEIHISGNPS
jgi:hypothetical protein